MENSMNINQKIKEMAGRIRELREITGLSVEEMARRTGVSEEEYAAKLNMVTLVHDLFELLNDKDFIALFT